MTKRILLLVGAAASIAPFVLIGPTDAQMLPPPRFSPRVLTVRPDGVEKTAFARGERIVVLGEGFPKRLAPAYVLFRQGSERLLATVRLTAIGTFRTDVHVPFDAKIGPAVVRGATFPKISAAAQITVIPTSGRTIPTHDRDIALLGVGGIALVVVGSAMSGFVWWRRRGVASEPSSNDVESDGATRTDASPAVAKLREDVARWKDH